MLFSAEIYIFNIVSAGYSQVFVIFAAVIKKCNIQNEVTMDDLFREKFVVALTYLAYSISTSHTAMMWQMLPRRTKKWKTECMKRFLLRL